MKFTLKTKMRNLLHTLDAIIKNDNPDYKVDYSDIIQVRDECNEVINGIDSLLNDIEFDLE